MRTIKRVKRKKKRNNMTAGLKARRVKGKERKIRKRENEKEIENWRKNKSRNIFFVIHGKKREGEKEEAMRFTRSLGEKANNNCINTRSNDFYLTSTNLVYWTVPNLLAICIVKNSHASRLILTRSHRCDFPIKSCIHFVSFIRVHFAAGFLAIFISRKRLR